MGLYGCLFMLSGTILFIARLRDPLLVEKLKITKRKEHNSGMFFNDLSDGEQDERSKINSFLTTSLNTELVYAILKGI